MFNFFKKPELKGFKVCNNRERNKKHGIAAGSLEKLREKIADKFKMENFDLYFNGTLINENDYFTSIPNQSVIILVEDGDELKTGKQ